ncbi:MAG: hypothetical protein AAF557_16850 [Pseudomonadota bacterium]
MTKSYDGGDRPAISLVPGSFQPPSGYKHSSGHHGHQKSFTSTREAHHRGRKIKIKTTYRIEIDDSPLMLHTMVMDDGTVHCHGLPNYSFPSAIDLAKSIIDASRLAHYETDDIGPADCGHGDNSGHHGSKNPTHGGDH